MSGDTQTKRRKEKKKKKDNGEEALLQPATPPPIIKTPSSTSSPPDDMTIHVQKESVIGGGYCAKFVFIVFLGAIAAFLGILITEPQRLNELSLTEQSAYISEYLVNWMDIAFVQTTPEDDSIDENVSHISHEIEEVDEEEHEDEDDEENKSDQHEDLDQEELEHSEENEENDDEDDKDETFDENEISEEDEEHSNEDIDSFHSEEEKEEDEQEHESAEEDKDDDNEIEDPIEESEENMETFEQEIDEIDEEEEHHEDEEIEEKIKVSKEVKPTKKESAPEDKTESSNMVIKFGVGAALLVVARIVLVRKWRTVDLPAIDNLDEQVNEVKLTKEESVPDYARRNTIVLPPTLDDVGTTAQDVSEEDEEDEDDEEDEENDDEKSPQVVLQYMDLQTTYFQRLKPDGEPTEEYEHDDDEENDEEIENNDNNENKDDDDELLRRLEQKYGKLSGNNDDEDDDEVSEEYEEDDEEDLSWKQKSAEDEENVERRRLGPQSVYEFDNITNPDDYTIRDELDKATRLLNDDTAFALTLFEELCKKNPYSPRSLYGKAKALDILAEKYKSNKQLEKSIQIYYYTLNLPDIPLILFRIVAERCIDRMRFKGLYNEAIEVNKKLIEKFPQDLQLRNELAVNFLTSNKIQNAKQILEETLKKWPNEGFALVHYGFVLKTFDNNLIKAVEYLKRGIDSKVQGVVDGRFYFHLGDALTRLGQIEEAYKVYSEGASLNLFPSAYQRSLYNVKGLIAKPWWTINETPYTTFFQLLKRNWKSIRDEGLSVLNKQAYFKDEAENLRDIGEWKQFELFSRGIKNENCARCPITCKLIENLSDARFCTRGQVKFSVMHPGTHVWPHCGPTNCRLRSHLGLKVPPNTFIRVGNETRSWKESEILIFDDSFDHEVWHNGTEVRLVLIVDVWHPNLSNKLKRMLPAI